MAESTAPSAAEGVDVQDWDQVLVVLGGDADGYLDIQPWLRYAKFDSGAGRADIWVPLAEQTDVPVAGYTAGTTSSGAVVVNTYGADRLHVLITGLTTATEGYLKYYGLTPAGGTSQPLPGGSSAVSILTGAKIQLTDWTTDSVLSSGGGLVVAGIDDAGEPTHRVLKLDATGRQRVVGAADEDAAVAGYPVLIGGRYDTTPRALDNGDVGAIALSAAGKVQIDLDSVAVQGMENEGTPVGYAPALVGGRYDASPRALDSGDAGAIALAATGHVLVDLSGGTVEGTISHDSAVSTQKPLVIGATASAADPTAVSADQDVVRLSADLYGYLRARSKAYDAVATADRVSPTVDPSDRYEEAELVDTTNVAAATNYYPSSAGLTMGGYDSIAIQGVISGGVTATIEATLDDASSPDWADITKAGLDLISGAALNASFVDTNFVLDFSGLRVKAIRVKSVTSDASNGVQYHYKRTRVGG